MKSAECNKKIKITIFRLVLVALSSRLMAYILFDFETNVRIELDLPGSLIIALVCCLLAMDISRPSNSFVLSDLGYPVSNAFLFATIMFFIYTLSMGDVINRQLKQGKKGGAPSENNKRKNQIYRNTNTNTAAYDILDKVN